MYKVVYTPNALSEFEESISWYSERSITVAEKFMIEVGVGINKVRNHPYRFKNIYKNFFEIKVRKFPFDIIYIIEKERIVIISIYHQKRNPKRKYQ